jgi:hypothetical protein
MKNHSRYSAKHFMTQHRKIWKAALDALVSIGGSTAADLLRKAESNVAAERCDWIREALQQFV